MNFLPAATERAREALDPARGPWHLWLDKFSFPDPDFFSPKKSPKMLSLELIREVYHSKHQQERLADCCQAHADFRKALSTQLGATRYKEVSLVNVSRLLPHLGRVSALENVGLAFDRTTGLPVIPGSAVKGVVSTWACWEENFNPADQSFNEGKDFRRYRGHFKANLSTGLARRILGENPADAPSGINVPVDAAGQVIFLGGFPRTPPQLDLDLVNPHHDEKGKPKEPIPSPFLAWAIGCTWVFPFFTRASVADPKLLLDTAERWLDEALTQYGLGAKTAAGYGRFLSQAAYSAQYVPAEAETGSCGAGSKEGPPKVPPKAKPALPTYEIYVAKTRNWMNVADKVLDAAKWEQEFIVKFFGTPEGRSVVAKWGGGLNAMRLKANLSKTGWEEEP